jgi:hypothetical protein
MYAMLALFLLRLLLNIQLLLLVLVVRLLLKNIDLETCLSRIYEDNDYMRKLLGWLIAQEPQLGMLVAEFKRADGHGLGFEKVGESSDEISGERETETSQLHSMQPMAE